MAVRAAAGRQDRDNSSGGRVLPPAVGAEADPAMSTRGRMIDAEWLAADIRVCWVETAADDWAALHWPNAYTPRDETSVTAALFGCGATADRAHIPGLSSRISSPRCEGCCDAAGLPRGFGSPVNDKACRRLILPGLWDKPRPPPRRHTDRGRRPRSCPLTAGGSCPSPTSLSTARTGGRTCGPRWVGSTPTQPRSPSTRRPCDQGRGQAAPTPPGRSWPRHHKGEHQGVIA